MGRRHPVHPPLVALRTHRARLARFPTVLEILREHRVEVDLR
ncbi:hypothetical protein [Kitasatospora sp. NPDC047058]